MNTKPTNIRLNEQRRHVLRNALAAEIESLAGIVYSDDESTEDKAYYKKQLQIAKKLMGIVE